MTGDLARIIAEKLRNTPLYEGSGETSSLPDLAADEIDRLRKEVARLRRDCVDKAAALDMLTARSARASCAEAKVEEMAKALRAVRGWLAKVDAPNGDDFLNDDGWDELRAALSQRSEIEPGRPAADAPKENPDV